MTWWSLAVVTKITIIIVHNSQQLAVVGHVPLELTRKDTARLPSSGSRIGEKGGPTRIYNFVAQEALLSKAPPRRYLQ